MWGSQKYLIRGLDKTGKIAHNNLGIENMTNEEIQKLDNRNLVFQFEFAVDNLAAFSENMTAKATGIAQREIIDYRLEILRRLESPK